MRVVLAIHADREAAVLGTAGGGGKPTFLPVAGGPQELSREVTRTPPILTWCRSALKEIILAAYLWLAFLPLSALSFGVG